MDFKDQLNRYLGPAMARVKGMVSRCVIKNVNDGAKVQTMDIGLLAGELRNGVERYQEYGFTSVPLPGMEAFVCFVGGERGNPVIVATGDRQFRIKSLESGEVCIYTDEGDKITLKRDHNIVVDTETLTMNAKKIIMNASESVEINTATETVNASSGVTITTPTTEISGQTNVGGAVAAGGNISGAGEITDGTGSMSGIRGTYNSHTHLENGPGSDTEVPNQLME